VLVVVVSTGLDVVELGTHAPLFSWNPSSHKQTGANAARDAFGTHWQVSEVIGSNTSPSQFLHAPEGVWKVPAGQASVVVVVVVLVVVVIGEHSPWSSIKPSSQPQIGIPSSKDALSVQLHSTVISGTAIFPKHRIQFPKIFLAKLFSQSAWVVVEVVEVVVVVVVMGKQSPLSSANPSSHPQTGIPSRSEAFSLQLQSTVINGIAMFPKHRIQSPRIFLAKLFSHSASVVVVVVVVVVVGEKNLVQVLSVSVNPSSHWHQGAISERDASAPQVQSSVESGSSITPKQRIQSPRIFRAKLAEQAW
jgi:hypothetical protein